MSNQPNMRLAGAAIRSRMRPEDIIPQPPQRKPVQVNLNEQTSLHCPQCKASAVIPRIQMFELSPLISPNGQSTIVNAQDYACLRCGWCGSPQQMLRLSPQDRKELASESKGRASASPRSG